MVCLEAGVRLLETVQRPEEEPGSHEEDEREADLRGDQDGASPRAAGAAGVAPAEAADPFDHPPAASLDGRNQADRESRGDREGEAEEEHREIDSDLGGAGERGRPEREEESHTAVRESEAEQPAEKGEDSRFGE